MTQVQLIKAIIAKNTWKFSIKKIVSEIETSFNQHNIYLMRLLSQLEGREQPYEELLDFFDGNPDYLFAVLLQNEMHPQNRQRVQAVKQNQYKEISSVEKAHDFLAETLEANLGNVLMATQAEVTESFRELS